METYTVAKAGRQTAPNEDSVAVYIAGHGGKGSRRRSMRMRFIRMRSVQRDFTLPIWAIEGSHLHRRRACKYIICMRSGEKDFTTLNMAGVHARVMHMGGHICMRGGRITNMVRGHRLRGHICMRGGCTDLGPGRESEGSGRS